MKVRFARKLELYLINYPLPENKLEFQEKMDAFWEVCFINLSIDTNTLKMSSSTLDAQAQESRFINVDDVDSGCFVAPPSKDRIVITLQYHNNHEVSVEIVQISSKSDTYKPGHNYGGVIIYQYNGKSEWQTANDTLCKSACIVMQDTDSESVKKWTGTELGVVHGAVYRNAFGESVNDAEVVGEGFAVRNGKFEMCSGVFNNPSGSAFHDRRRRMHELSEHCVRKVVEYWKNAYPSLSSKTKYEVKKLLEDFDLKLLST